MPVSGNWLLTKPEWPKRTAAQILTGASTADSRSVMAPALPLDAETVGPLRLTPTRFLSLLTDHAFLTAPLSVKTTL